MSSLDLERLVGQIAGQDEMCTCSPSAINANLANGLVFSPHMRAPIFPKGVAASLRPAPSPELQVSFS